MVWGRKARRSKPKKSPRIRDRHASFRENSNSCKSLISFPESLEGSDKFTVVSRRDGNEEEKNVPPVLSFNIPQCISILPTSLDSLNKGTSRMSDHERNLLPQSSILRLENSGVKMDIDD